MKQVRTRRTRTENQKQKKPATEKAFREFHNRYPFIYHSLVFQALIIRKFGTPQCSLRGIYEFVRCHMFGSMCPEMKLSFMAHYRKLILEELPDMKNFLM